MFLVGGDIEGGWGLMLQKQKKLSKFLFVVYLRCVQCYSLFSVMN